MIHLLYDNFNIRYQETRLIGGTKIGAAKHKRKERNAKNGDYEMSWKDHLDKFGVIGSFVAALCCLGVPAVVSIVASIGLGFLINDAILLPLMVLFLLVTVMDLYLRYRSHRRVSPLILGIVSSLVALFFVFGHTVRVMAAQRFHLHRLTADQLVRQVSLS
jgi:mercuric ion transport protein